MSKIKVGIVGCGNIGSFVARKIEEVLSDIATVEYLFDINADSARALKETIKHVNLAYRLRDVFSNSDLAVEAATREAVEEILLEAKSNRCPTVIMSVGGLLGQESLLHDLKKRGTKIYVPSGAIGGLDIFKSLDCDDVHFITLSTFKPPAGLANVPFISEQKIDLFKLTDERVVFEGSVDEAVNLFPKNINVAATLAVISRCKEKINVKIVASPTIDKNIHHIIAEGTFGRVEITCQNRPSEENPKTSELARLSCLQAVKEAIDDMLFFQRKSGGI